LIVVAVLAAGRGERFGGEVPKPLLTLHRRPLLAYALDAARGSEAGPVAVVYSDPRVGAAVPEGVAALRNETPEAGIASSLQVALRFYEAQREIDAVVVGLADQPRVGRGAYARVAAAYDDGARLAVATYHGTRGNPVLLARAHWREALALTGDEGARVLLRRHDPTEVPCEDTGEPIDVDTPADLAALEEQQWK
jgi:CTP:molybdopterin cytidylyltransferase MocA